MALLSYQTLLRVRRAVALYDGRPPHPRPGDVLARPVCAEAVPRGGERREIEEGGRPAARRPLIFIVSAD